MNTLKKKTIFVVAIKNIKTGDGVRIDKGDVAIMESSENDSAFLFFIRIGRTAVLHKKDFKIFDVLRVGDSFSNKICNICHKLLSTSKFAKNQNGKNNRSVRRPSCSECRKQLEGIDIPAKIKSEWKKNKPHQVSFECPICAKRTIAGVTSKIVLDHDHRNGKVRGWVCDSCNTGIGRFKDDVELVKRAIKFIE